VLVIAGLGAACGLFPSGGTAATPTTVAATVTYDNGVLHVADVALTQFAGYQRDTLFTAPPGWPRQAELAIDSKQDPFKTPKVSAAVLQPDVLQPSALFTMAEEGAGLENAPIVAESSIKSIDRDCSYRIRVGPMDGDPTKPRGAIGTIVATGPTRPHLGVTIDRGLDAPEDSAAVEHLTRQVAETICHPS
jgi:hypothetical protein